jgi:hypothetical protein
MQLLENERGHYRFLKGIAPYSAGVAAMTGYEIVHAVFQTPPPILEGFDRISRHLEAQGLPRQHLCALELRIPQPLSFSAFSAFNEDYLHVLDDWDLLVGTVNPVARTNVSPEHMPPAEPALYAFSYTAPSSGDVNGNTFIVAGAGDLRDQADLAPEAIVRGGEISRDALKDKAEVVLQVMTDRLTGLNRSWQDVTAVDVYTVHPLRDLLQLKLLPGMNDSSIHGIRWHFSRPPIEGLEFEMDVRGVHTELIIQHHRHRPSPHS